MTDQQLSILRWALNALGVYLANRGLISNADLSALMAAILGVIGPAMMLFTAIWGWYTHSRDAKVAAVLALSPAERMSALPPAMLIKAVNSDQTNGVKVVAESAPALQVNSPIPPKPAP